MEIRSIEDVDVAGKRVFVRCDFNVPIDSNSHITNNNRIVSALTTIEYLINHNAKVILCSHLGRPKGKFDLKYSLKPVADELDTLLKLKKRVILTKDVIGNSAQEAVSNMNNGDVVLLENVRFHAEEEKNDGEFASKLALLADVYVNDAFGTAHRAHASTEGITRYLPSVCGFLLKREIETMGRALENPERPFVAILGGAKVSEKINVIVNLLDKVDTLIIGGAMAYTFYKANGYEVGTSLCEDDRIKVANDILKLAKDKGVDILIPIDNVIASEFSPDAKSREVNSDSIPDNMMGMDIGQRTVELFTDAIKLAKTVIWNGPMGVFEFDRFATGTQKIAEAVANVNGTTIVGGGDSVSALKKSGFIDRISHVSTGGGASLEFLEGKKLPGIEGIRNNRLPA